MPLTIDERMRLQFDLATFRRLAQKLQAPDDWRRADRIRQRSQALRTEAKEAYEHGRDWRVAGERRRLIDEAGKRHLQPSPPFATGDGFDPERTRRLAEDAVRLRHEARINRIDRAEAAMLGRLVRDVETLKAERPSETFARNARDGPKRTGPGQD